MLNPTPREKLCDQAGRPYFLWDGNLTLEEFEALLADPNADVRAHAIGKLLRQARPDDALTLLWTGSDATGTACAATSATAPTSGPGCYPSSSDVPPRLPVLHRLALHALAPLEPRWTLTGGGALVGFYLGHRVTRDVDLFFHGLSTLDRLPEDAIAALTLAGVTVGVLQRAPAFCRLRVDRAGETLLVDLVAEPVAWVFAPEPHRVEGVEILVDSRAEILVNKLAALYSRLEIRDLVDVQALVGAGEDLDAALGLVARKNGGFSPPDLAWILRSMDVAALAKAEGYDAAVLVAFRERLVDRLLA